MESGRRTVLLALRQQNLRHLTGWWRIWKSLFNFMYSLFIKWERVVLILISASLCYWQTHKQGSRWAGSCYQACLMFKLLEMSAQQVQTSKRVKENLWNNMPIFMNTVKHCAFCRTSCVVMQFVWLRWMLRFSYRLLQWFITPGHCSPSGFLLKYWILQCFLADMS